MNLIFIVDIDGTVADTNRRIKRITKKYKIVADKWTDEHIDEFADPKQIKNDKIMLGAEMLPELARKSKAKMIFLTGRSELARKSTRMWLKHNLDIFDTVPLIMREHKDYSDPSECKYKLFTEVVLKMYSESSFVFFDDDKKLLKRYAEHGMALLAPDCCDIIKNDYLCL